MDNANPTTPDPLPYGAIRHPKCGGWWTGLTRAHCPVCCRTFSCDSAADKHRKGAHGKDRHCVDPATVGLVAKPTPFGVMWQNPGPEESGDERPTTWTARADGDPERVA